MMRVIRRIASVRNLSVPARRSDSSGRDDLRTEMRDSENRDSHQSDDSGRMVHRNHFI